MGGKIGIPFGNGFRKLKRMGSINASAHPLSKIKIDCQFQMSVNI